LTGNENPLSNQIEDYSPYCKICDSCGEDGCCSALSCKQDPNGDYCKTYLKDLQFGYRMYKELVNLLENDEKYQKQIDEIWDKTYDITYGE